MSWLEASYLKKDTKTPEQKQYDSIIASVKYLCRDYIDTEQLKTIFRGTVSKEMLINVRQAIRDYRLTEFRDISSEKLKLVAQYIDNELTRRR